MHPSIPLTCRMKFPGKLPITRGRNDLFDADFTRGAPFGKLAPPPRGIFLRFVTRVRLFYYSPSCFSSSDPLCAEYIRSVASRRAAAATLQREDGEEFPCVLLSLHKLARAANENVPGAF